MRNLQGPSRQQAGGRGPAQRRERPGLALAVSGPGRLARPPATLPPVRQLARGRPQAGTRRRGSRRGQRESSPLDGPLLWGKGTREGGTLPSPHPV